MHFRLTYEITGYSVPLKDNPLIITIGGADNLSIVVTQAPADPQKSTQAANLIQVLAEVEPPRKATEALREMLNESANPQRDKEARDEQLLRSPSLGGSDTLPASLRDFSAKLYDHLADVATDGFALIRWRFALSGPVRPYIARGFEWSEDKTSWKHLPYKITWRMTARAQQRLRNEDASELEAMISSGRKEPLSHILLREARASATTTGSYASALVMSMAALEIGAKHLIAELLPGAQWLALNTPTPPIIRILSEYLPTLPARQLLGGKPISVPSALIETLKKGVTARNSAAHAGLPISTRDFVERVLDAVGDLLWIFDYYSGSEWAIDHLSAETRATLGIGRVEGM